MGINLLKDMADAVKATVKQEAKTSAYDTQATVRRIESGVAWVHIPGGVDETPAQLTISAKAGDVVQVRIGGGSAWLVGNLTAPPTDDTKAKEAEEKAAKASGIATNFVTDTKDGIFVHPKDNTDDGVRITNAIDILKGGLSFLRAYIDNGVAKVRVGREDSGHSIIDSNGMRIYAGNGQQMIADIGYIEFEPEEHWFAPYATFGDRHSGSAIGEYSMAEGNDITASGSNSHAEGESTVASGNNSHAEGSYTTASGDYSHAEGISSKASGHYSHAEGNGCTASGNGSHAGGIGNSAAYEGQTVIGKYASAPASDDLLLVGNGTGASARSNAMRLKASGRVEFDGAVGSGLSWTTRTLMISAVSALAVNRPYAFYAGATWTNTAGAGNYPAFGTICKMSTTAWHMFFMCGGSLYKSLFTWDGSTSGTFSTTLIG